MIRFLRSKLIQWTTQEPPCHKTGKQRWVDQWKCPTGGKSGYAEYIPLQFVSSINSSSDSGGFTALLLFFTGCILLLKSFHPAGRIHNLLFACHKGMALRTYLNSYVLPGGFCFNHIPARAGDCRLRIFRMNTFLHCLLLSSSFAY